MPAASDVGRGGASRPSGFSRSSARRARARVSLRLRPECKLRRVKDAKHEIIELGRPEMRAIVVEDRGAEAVEVVRRPQRLGDLLDQAGPDQIGRGAVRDEDGHRPEGSPALERPSAIAPRAAADIAPGGRARHDHAVVSRDAGAEGATRHEADDEVVRRGRPGDRHARPAAQLAEVAVEEGAVPYSLRAEEADAHRCLIAHQVRPVPAPFQLVRQRDEEIGEAFVGIGRMPGRRRGAELAPELRVAGPCAGQHGVGGRIRGLPCQRQQGRQREDQAPHRRL